MFNFIEKGTDQFVLVTLKKASSIFTAGFKKKQLPNTLKEAMNDNPDFVKHLIYFMGFDAKTKKKVLNYIFGGKKLQFVLTVYFHNLLEQDERKIEIIENCLGSKTGIHKLLSATRVPYSDPEKKFQKFIKEYKAKINFKNDCESCFLL